MRGTVPAALAAGLDRLVTWLAYASGGILVCLAALTVADVTSRYLFNAPIFGAQDVSELGLVVVVFAAVPYCGRSGGHVAVGLFGDMMGPRVTRWTDTAVGLIAAALFALLAWRAGLSGLDAAEFNESSNLLNIPHGPFYAVIAAGAALYALVLLAAALDAALGRSTRGHV